MRTLRISAALAATLAAAPALAQDTKPSIGISGWTGFAPLTLAKEAGIFKKNGLTREPRRPVLRRVRVELFPRHEVIRQHAAAS